MPNYSADGYPRPTVEELEAALETMRTRHAATNARRMEQQTDVGDCALSCWTESSCEDELMAKLALARDGYLAEFPALFDLDGNEVEGAKLVNCKSYSGYGTVMKWVVNHANGSATWLPYTHPESMTPRKAANLAKKGYKVGTVKRPAHIVARGGSYIGAPISYFPVAD